MFFTSNEYSAPMEIKKTQNPGGRFGGTSYLNRSANLAHLALFLGKWAGLTALFCKDFYSFNYHGFQTFTLAGIHCYLSTLKSWHNNSSLSGVESALEFIVKIEEISNKKQDYSHLERISTQCEGPTYGTRRKIVASSSLEIGLMPKEPLWLSFLLPILPIFGIHFMSSKCWIIFSSIIFQSCFYSWHTFYI